MMSSRSSALCALAVLVQTAGCGGYATSTRAESAPVLPSDAVEPTLRDGVYSEQQAIRGAAEYSRACSSCHAEDLRGASDAPSLVGSSFLFLWEGKSLEELFASIRTRMPTNAPNSLPTQDYLDIVAYVLEANGFPVGETELVGDPGLLRRIVIIPPA